MHAMCSNLTVKEDPPQSSKSSRNAISTKNKENNSILVILLEQVLAKPRQRK